MAPKIIDTRVPNEWLVRWDNYGNVCESQISYLEHLEIDGVVRYHGVTAMQVLDHTDLPNLNIVSDMAENAMVAVNKLTAERDSLTKELDALKADHSALVSERDQIVAQAQNMRTELTGQVAERDKKLEEAAVAYHEIIEKVMAENRSASARINELTEALRNLEEPPIKS